MKIITNKITVWNETTAQISRNWTLNSLFMIY